jgi:hypothetical protein
MERCAGERTLGHWEASGDFHDCLPALMLLAISLSSHFE